MDDGILWLRMVCCYVSSANLYGQAPNATLCFWREGNFRVFSWSLGEFWESGATTDSLPCTSPLQATEFVLQCLGIEPELELHYLVLLDFEG